MREAENPAPERPVLCPPGPTPLQAEKTPLLACPRNVPTQEQTLLLGQ